eukprot:GHVU01132686.1.p2 GENE.GHVU01132686.1~~GHVU01132686.1.p2  ORF type:complete len:124 (-),score=5.68 GHVU01132686.1:165-536(-)
MGSVCVCVCVCVRVCVRSDSPLSLCLASLLEEIPLTTLSSLLIKEVEYLSVYLFICLFVCGTSLTSPPSVYLSPLSSLYLLCVGRRLLHSSTRLDATNVCVCASPRRVDRLCRSQFDAEHCGR